MTTTSSHQDTVFESIAAVAPDVLTELESIDGDQDLFEELELDSMDHVNVMTQIFERTGLTIAERDYAKLRTVNSLTNYLVSNLDR